MIWIDQKNLVSDNFLLKYVYFGVEQRITKFLGISFLCLINENDIDVDSG